MRRSGPAAWALGGSEEGLRRLARCHGRTRVRLDTRADLLAARSLYARPGYAEVDPFNTGPYAEHWLAEDVLPGHERPAPRP